MRVYRLETHDGQGPYRIPRPSATVLGFPTTSPIPRRYASYLHIEQATALSTGGYLVDGEDPHPAPWEDGLDRPTAYSALDSSEYCGFESAEAMEAWFFREPHDPQALTEMGLLVTIWEVDEARVRKGRKQVVFERDEAVIIDTMTPLAYANNKEN